MIDTKELLAALKAEQIINKYMYKNTWLSGSSTTVYPITFWKNEVEIQLNTKKNLFEKFIDRFVEQHGDLVISGSFCKMDDSCPATLTFYYNIPENQGYIKGRAINKATRLFWNKNKRELIEQATNLKNFMRLAEQAYNTALDGLTTFKEETAYTAVDYWKKKNSLSDDDYSFLLNEYELEKRIIDL